MSWLDQIKTDLIITCGDSNNYTPNWINARKLQEYNVAEFDFPEVDGTLVKRTRPLGVKYNLEIYFQGDDNLAISKNFHISANDPRAWILQHPYYGRLIVQPIALEFDNSNHNVTKISGTVIETITDDNPKTSISAIDAIPIQKSNTDAAYQAVRFVPLVIDTKNLTYNNARNFKLGVSIVKIASEFEDYNHAFNLMNGAIDNAFANISASAIAMNLLISFIEKPAKFTVDLKNRLNILNLQFGNVRQNIASFVNAPTKYTYQVYGGSLVGSMALATSNLTDSDLKLNANDILAQMSLINSAYQNYLSDLDSIQSLNNGNTTSFIPDANSLTNLNLLVNTAISNLFSIALSSKQERSIITEKDTNIILLTHELYGLDNSDENIEELIVENNIGINELIQIKKGRKILYYI